MTNVDVIETWTREELENAFIQREQQLVQDRDLLDRLARAEALLRCAMCNPAQSMMRIGDWEHDATALLVELKERAT